MFLEAGTRCNWMRTCPSNPNITGNKYLQIITNGKTSHIFFYFILFSFRMYYTNRERYIYVYSGISRELSELDVRLTTILLCSNTICVDNTQRRLFIWLRKLGPIRAKIRKISS